MGVGELPLCVGIGGQVDNATLDPVVGDDHLSARGDLLAACLQDRFVDWLPWIALEVGAVLAEDLVELVGDVKVVEDRGECPHGHQSSARTKEAGGLRVPDRWVYPVPGVGAPDVIERPSAIDDLELFFDHLELA